MAHEYRMELVLNAWEGRPEGRFRLASEMICLLLLQAVQSSANGYYSAKVRSDEYLDMMSPNLNIKRE